MRDWNGIIAGIEALEPARFDHALIERMRARGLPSRPINFYTPTFKAYASSEISSCGRSAWPAVSITGGTCKLQCDHCRAKILEPMVAARTPDALWRVVNDAIGQGARGMLLSGGSNHRDEVEYAPFLPTVRRIKDSYPDFRIAIHTALVDRDAALAIEASGVDAAMLDIIGAQDTIAQVYHLRRPVADFERSLEHLVATSMKVVPHIVIGLHYGTLLGEWAALEMIARHRPTALVLVVAMPFYAPSGRPFATPDPSAVGQFFLDARTALPETPVLLGCARPAGRVKIEIDTYSVLAGLQGIAHPADGTVELALALGRDARVTPACCSIAVERKKVVGVPVQCAEFIPLPLLPHTPQDVRAQAIDRMATFLPSGERAERAFNGVMIRRDRFDQALAARASDAGAVLWTDSVLHSLDPEARTATVRTAGGARAIAYRLVIAADGPHSGVAACLGLPRLQIVNTRQYTVSLLRPHSDTDIWLSDAYPGGYAWLFPKGSVANLGLGIDPRFDTEMKTPLDALHRALAAQGRIGGQILMRTGGAIPVNGLRDQLVVGDTVFVGDAAGFTHPITGAGIAPAVASGLRAGGAAAAFLGGDRCALAEYQEEMREEFGPTLTRGLTARRRMERLWRTPQAHEDATLRGAWIAFDEYFTASGAQ